MQNKEYSENTSISASSLKDWEYMDLKSWKAIYLDKKSEKFNKLFFNKGSYLDSLLLNPDNIEEFYYVADFKSKISESVQIIIDSIYKVLLEIYQEETCNIDFSDIEDVAVNDVIIVQSINANYGNGGYKNERIIKEIREKGKEYFDFLCKANGRTIISNHDHHLALDKQHILLNTGYTKSSFVQQPDELLYHHLQIFSDDNLKCELDILRIVPSEETIYINDLKTTHTITQFFENLRKYKYATQLGFYKFMVEKLSSGLCNTNKEIIFLSEWKNFDIVCQNIVIDEKSLVPMIYRYTKGSLDYHQYGSESLKLVYPNVKYKKGWLYTLMDIRKHIELDRWDLPLEHIEKGYIEVDLLK